MFQVLRKMLVLSLAAAVVVGVVAAFASAAAKPPNRPTITFASPPSPNDGATLTTTNSGSFAFSYNRTATQTKTLTCALVGPTPTSTPLTGCDAVTAIPGGSRSGMPFSGLPNGSYMFTVTLTLTDHGTTSATRHFVINAPCSVVNTRTHVAYTDLAPAITAATAGDELDITGTCTGNYTVGKDLTLQGIDTAGAKATLDGNQTGTVLNFDPNLTFTVNNLTIQHGHGVNGGGVAIHDNSTFAFNHDTVIHNTAERTGGGFYIDDVSTGYIIDTTVTGNMALVGGLGVDVVNAGVTFVGSVVETNFPARPDLQTADVAVFINPQIAYFHITAGLQVFPYTPTQPSIIPTIDLTGNTSYTADALSSAYFVKVVSSSWSAATPMCVKDQQSGIEYPTLQLAVDHSAPGDDLQVNGTCKGQTIFTKDVNVTGPGVLDGGGTTTPVIVNQGVHVTLTNLSVTNGTGDTGGGIRNDGTLGLLNTTVSGNTANGSGGGIYNTGSLGILASAITGNNAAVRGGGIANFGGDVTVSPFVGSGVSDISNNSSMDGGGVYNSGAFASFLMIAASIHGNSAVVGGGIFMDDGSTSVLQGGSTITANTALDVGGGVFRASSAGVLIIEDTSSVTGNIGGDVYP